LNVPVELRKGRLGQFDVVVNGRTVLYRKGGLVARIVNRPWPSEDDVVSAVSAALTEGKAGDGE
jgi:hypothetical protein